MASIVAAMVVIIFIYRFVDEWYGPLAASIAAVLAALSPNLIAHGTVATSDGYFAAGVLAAIYYLRRYLLDLHNRNAFFSALALALAQLAKPMAIYLYLIAGLFVIVAMIRPVATPDSAKGDCGLRGNGDRPFSCGFQYRVFVRSIIHSVGFVSIRK